MGFLGPMCLAQQPNKDVQSVTVTIFGAAAQHRLRPPVAKRSVESPTCMDIRKSEFREFGEPLRPGEQISVEAVAAHLQANGFARWQVPNRIELLDEIPRTSVGKFDKKVLRARFDP